MKDNEHNYSCLKFTALVLAAVCLILLGGSTNLAQEKKQKPKREYIDASAKGTGTQMSGRFISVRIMIEEYSTEEDRQVLLDAFEKAGNEGLINALSKMKAKGRISIPGTLGFDLNFIRQIPTTDGGRRIRFVTDRPVTFGEAWTSSRSMEYNPSAGEINLSKVKDKSTGTLAPRCQFTVDKKTKELTLELYQNPWELVNIRVSK